MNPRLRIFYDELTREDFTPVELMDSRLALRIPRLKMLALLATFSLGEISFWQMLSVEVSKSFGLRKIQFATTLIRDTLFGERVWIAALECLEDAQKITLKSQ